MKSRYLLPLTLLITLPSWALDIYPQVSGTIVEIKAPGTEIKQGEVLVTLDNRQAQLEVEYLTAILAIKQQEFDDAKLHLDQTQELYDRLVASHRDLEEAQMNFNAAKRELAAHQVKIQIAQIELEKYQIRSPIDATVESLVSPRNTTNINQPQALMRLAPK